MTQKGYDILSDKNFFTNYAPNVTKIFDWNMAICNQHITYLHTLLT